MAVGEKYTKIAPLWPKRFCFIIVRGSRELEVVFKITECETVQYREYAITIFSNMTID